MTDTFEAIGTRWQITLYDPPTPARGTSALATARARIEQFDQVYSRFRPDSLVSAMARSAGEYQLPPDARPLLDLYRRLYELTQGAFTPFIGQTLAAAGYDAAYSLRPAATLPVPPAWDEICRWDADTCRLTLYQPALIDVGAAGKGYLVDLVAATLAAQGVADYTIDASGDLRHHHPGARSLRIGLEHPADPALAIGVAELGEGSLCGSAGNRRRWDRYHHIIDPRLLASPTAIQAAWVTASTALVADGLATALFLVPPEQLRPHATFEYLILAADQSASYSPGFPGQLFS